MEDVADQEYVEVQHVADHEDPALSDSWYASNIWVSNLHTDWYGGESILCLPFRDSWLVESGSIFWVSTS